MNCSTCGEELVESEVGTCGVCAPTPDHDGHTTQASHNPWDGLSPVAGEPNRDEVQDRALDDFFDRIPPPSRLRSQASALKAADR